MANKKDSSDSFVLFLSLVVGGLLLYFGLFRNKKSSDSGVSNKDSASKSGSSGSSGSDSINRFFPGKMNTDFNPYFIESDDSDLIKNKKSLYQKIGKVLYDYDFYCKKLGWTQNFIVSENTISNILVHFLIETGNLKFLHDFNYGNITQGSWTSPSSYYKASPYIKDFYGHNYLGCRVRSDRGVKDDKQNFRMYEFPEDGIMDYLDLINRGRRYKNIAKLYDLSDVIFIKELGLAGYYTADIQKMYETAKNIRNNLF